MKMFLVFILNLLLLVPICFSQQKASEQGSQSGSFIPAGVVMPYAGTTAPSGWAFAYGQEVSQTSATYKNLYAAISTTYCTTEHGGTCTGGNFRLPDLRGRSIHGKDNMGGTAASRITSAATIDGTVLGKSGGGQTNTLAAGNIPQISGTISGTAQSGGVDHTHTTPASLTINYSIGAGSMTSTGDRSVQNNQAVTTGGASSYLHTHTLSGTATIGSASPSAVNNLAPTTIMNYIIKL